MPTGHHLMRTAERVPTKVPTDDEGQGRHRTTRHTQREVNSGIQKKGFMLCSLCFSEVLGSPRPTGSVWKSEVEAVD
jgi:hypothetical protein